MPLSTFITRLKHLWQRQQGAGHDVAGDVISPPEASDKPVVKLDTATGLMVEKFFKKGRVHRDDDHPAVIEYEPQSKRVVREQYFQHGVLHREGGKPAYVEYCPITGHVTLEVFFEQGRLYHGENTPSAINYDNKTGARIMYDVTRPGSPPIQSA
jgi:hypothetical protein